LRVAIQKDRNAALVYDGVAAATKVSVEQNTHRQGRLLQAQREVQAPPSAGQATDGAHARLEFALEGGQIGPIVESQFVAKASRT